MTVLHRRAIPTLYPAICAGYRWLARCSRQTASPKCSRVVGEKWCRLTPSIRIRSEVRGRIESDSSSLYRTILGRFRKEVGDKGRDKTYSLVFD